MRKTKNITIDNVNYVLEEMLATKRSIIALELKSIASGASLGVGNISEGLDTEINYTKAVTGVLDKIEPKKGAELLRDLIMSGIQFPMMRDTNGFPDYDKYDEYFGEFYHHQIELVGEIAKFNFGKSIDEIKKKLSITGMLSLISSVEKESRQD